jgi:hypothetical protein
MTIRTKALPADHAEVKAVKDGVLEFVISHEAPDLVGDVVVQRGMQPVSTRIPAQVDHSGKMADVIGYWDNIRTHGDHTTANLNLVDRGVSKMADLVRALAESGVKLAASVGFMVKSAEPLKPRGMKFKETLLHEVSVVVVPCHPLALQVAKSLGLDLPAGQVDEDAQMGKQQEVLNRARAAILKAKRTIRS